MWWLLERGWEMCPGNGGLCSRRGSLQCGGAPGNRDGLASTVCPAEREGVTGSVNGNMLEPKRNLYSRAGLTGPKVWGHQHSQNRLLCQHLLQTLCNFYHFLQALQFPTCPGCHSTVGSCACLHPTGVRMGMYVVNLGMGTVTSKDGAVPLGLGRVGRHL